MTGGVLSRQNGKFSVFLDVVVFSMKMNLRNYKKIPIKVKMKKLVMKLKILEKFNRKVKGE